MSAETDRDDQVTQLPLNKGKKGVANTNITSSNPTDPFIGKAVAFGCNSDFGKELHKEFGKEHLDEKVGHLVGTVMRRSRGLGKYHQKQINYDVAWEFSSLGSTSIEWAKRANFRNVSTHLPCIKRSMLQLVSR
jgi:hypothetical protein